MAKRGGGLGRGLSSLLGGSYEEASNYRAPQSAPAEEKTSTDSVEAAPNESRRVLYNEEGEEISPVSQKELEELAIKAKEKETGCLPIEKIVPNPDQPRSSFKQEPLEELAASIARDGLLQPILVREQSDGTYQIIAGERRWQASKIAGLTEIPVRIIDSSDDKVLELAMVENVQRADLNPIEEAYGYRRLMETKGLTQAEVAEVVSKGRSTIANALRLLDLPEDAQQLLFEEKITAGHARAILSIPTEEGRQTLTNKLLSEQLSVREAEAIARLLSGKVNTPAQTRAALPKSYKKVAKALRTTLGTNVRVKSAGGKNKIEIEFKDEEDLKRLFDQIVKEG